MKRLLSLGTIMLVFVLLLASCNVINSVIGLHTVSFDLNGGVGGEDFSESVNVLDGKTVKLPTPTKEEYTFDGWFNGEELFTEESTVTSDLTLTAKWHPNKVTVSFIDYFGNLISTETIDYGSSVTAPSVDAVIGNQKFIEWDKDLSCVTEDITVNAVYGDNIFTITYNCGEVADGFTETCFMGELPSFPEVPVAEGHVFFGWYLDEEMTDRYFFDYTLDRDITLYAKFYDTSLGEYIVISNVDQLMAIGEQPDAKYLLACDINCKGETLTPIDEFSGELEGNGYKIFNFSINETTNVSGFIRTNKGSISNLSFGNFTFDILVTSAAEKAYGLVAAINEGTIDNCHILDSEIKLDLTTNVSNYNYVGGILGHNYGIVNNCSNNAIIKITSVITPSAGNQSVDFILNCNIGGIVGRNESEATLTNSNNNGKIDGLIKAYGFLHKYNTYVTNYAARNGIACAWIGGVCGHNLGLVDSCSNTAEIIGNAEFLSDSYRAIYTYIGGALGQNDGKANNVYASGNITQLGDASELYFGGFLAINSGSVYNCYSSANFVSDSTVATTVGGFVAENRLVSGYPATINKCFSTGSITLAVAPTNSGYFAGKTTGTEKDCYYLDSMTVNVVTKTEITEGETTETIETIEPVTPTCTVGEAKSYAEITSVEFIENTLYFDRMIWLVVEGQLPTLR